MVVPQRASAFSIAWEGGDAIVYYELLDNVVSLDLGFGARFDWLQRILPSAQVLWAILLVVGGAWLVWRTVRRSRS